MRGGRYRRQWRKTGFSRHCTKAKSIAMQLTGELTVLPQWRTISGADTGIQREKWRNPMAIARVTELIATSATSVEDAIKNGVERACKTLENVQGAWVQDVQVKVKDNMITEFRVNLKVTFILTD
jgi:hypothetical protein